MGKYRLVPHDELRPGSNQRAFFPDIEKLAALIEESGWVNTLYVGTDGDITAGERRWRACGLLNAKAKKAGEPLPWAKVPCIVEDGSDDDTFDLNVAENAGRVDLRFIELARVMQKYREGRGLDNNAIGRKTGYHPDTVGSYLKILESCHPKIIERLDNGEQIPVEYLIKLKSIRDKDIQLLRLEQWLGNPVTETGEPVTSKQRKAGLSRRKMLATVKVLQESGASDETIEVAQFLAGLRQTLPHKWHLKLSRSRRRPPQD